MGQNILHKNKSGFFNNHVKIGKNVKISKKCFDFQRRLGKYLTKRPFRRQNKFYVDHKPF
jgi:hypothetical protein